LFFAYTKTGAKLKDGETVLPYFGPLNVDQVTEYDLFVSGRVFVARNKIMESSYNPESDPYEWYMLPVKMAIRKRERDWGRMKRRK
jgi:hypothetical protein